MDLQGVREEKRGLQKARVKVAILVRRSSKRKGTKAVFNSDPRRS
jgi:hypothetical protein